MATYSTITKKEVEKIAKQYGIIVLDFIPMSGGNANSNYKLITDNTDYILTIAEEKSFNEVLHLTQFLQWLQQHDYVTSEVLKDTNNELVIMLNKKPLFIKNWIKGTVYNDLNAIQLQAAGKALAQLHQISVPDYLPKGHPYGLSFCSDLLPEITDEEYKIWLQKELQYLKSILPKNLPKGLIHGDLFYDNILFQNNELKAIIDFEEACCYDFIFDIGMAILGMCMNEEEVDWNKAKMLLKGYQQIRGLEKEEQASLKLFIKYAAIATSCWRYWKYNIDSPTPKRKKKHWEMVSIVKNVG